MGRPRLPWARGRPADDRELPAFAEFGPDSTLETPWLLLANPGGMRIGPRVRIRPYAQLEALCAPGDVRLTIGAGTYIGAFSRITALGGVEIGNDCMFADRVYVSDTGHEYEDPEVPIIDQPLRVNRRVEIGDGAWIGIGAAIVGNVRIGRNAVVGANAVVTSDVPDHTVVAGNPARVVRRLLDGEWRWEAPR